MKCKDLFKKPIRGGPLFWVIFSTISLGLALFSIKYFAKANSILNLEISMSRQECMQKAKEIAQNYNLGPKNFSQVVYFDSDTNVQNYVELKLGTEAYAKLIEEKTYCPYTWKARHFQESNIHEVIITFTSDGQKYGFTETISEDEPAIITPDASLSTKDAQTKIEAFLNKWPIDLKPYELIQKSNDTKPNGRIDHYFVYERTDQKLGEAKYRLGITLSGNKITEINHYIKIPDSFYREYEQARSTNESIQSFANSFIYLIYFFICCFISLFYLLRRNWLITKQGLIFGIIIAFTEVINKLNDFPFIWISYSTTLCPKIYVIKYILNMIIPFLKSAVFYSIIVTTAEGLTRLAFGNRIQFWKIWNTEIASSKKIFGKTIASYLFLGFEFAFVTAFYLIGTKYFGWWMPSCQLTDPNILGTYMPGLSAIAQAFKAGFWEECLFRAIPLSICALIGQKFGYRNHAIAFGFILQAIIFGAAHASYPTLPGYVRLIELIIPSFNFGALYLAFGLLPSIILHFAFDAILMASPIFVCQSSAIMIEKIIAIIGILFPLIIIIFQRLKFRKWAELPQDAYNFAFNSNNNLLRGAPQLDSIQSETSLNALSKKYNIFDRLYKFLIQKWGHVALPQSAILAFCVFICFGLWLKFGNFTSDVNAMKFTKNEAIEKAQQILKEKNFVINPNWKISTDLLPNIDKISANFIWQNADKELFYKLSGAYIAQPEWYIRFAKFTGTQEERAEEFHVYINFDGKLSRFIHDLPEEKKGAELTENQAKEIALKAIEKQYNCGTNSIKSDQLTQIAAYSYKMSARQDWIFIFADKNLDLPQDAQARIRVVVSGNEVSDMYRYVHLVEKSNKDQEHRDQIDSLLPLIKNIISYIILAIAGLQFLLAWHRRGFPLGWTLLTGIAFAILSFILQILNFPTEIAYFSTSKSIFSQIWTNILNSLTPIIIKSSYITIFAGLVFRNKYINRINPTKYSPLGYGPLGFSIGIILLGLLAPIYYLVNSQFPVIPSFVGANSYWPILASSILIILSYINRSFFSLYLIESIKKFSSGTLSNWPTIAQLGSAFYLLSMALSVMPENLLAPGQWFFILGALLVIMYALYYFFYRHEPLLAPFSIAVAEIFKIFTQIYNNPFPGAIECAFTNIIAISLTSIGLIIFLKHKETIQSISSLEKFKILAPA